MKKNELSWNNLTLVPYSDTFFDYIYKCYQNYNSRIFFTNDFIIISRNEFWDYIKQKKDRDFHDFMIIIDNLSGLPIGFTYTYNFNIKNNHVYFSIYLENQSEDPIRTVYAGLIFFSYIFKYYPIRKIYCSIFDYNNINCKMLTLSGFKLEGILKKHRYFNRTYHDMKIYSLFREDFYTLKERLKNKF